jgi:small nuclear ribonucleoprotein (snRNP)-like protein
MPKDNGYRILKLKNGESLIGKITNIQNNNIILKSVFVYKTLTMSNPGIGSRNIVILRPWIELTDEEKIVVSSDIVAAITTPSDVMMFHYEREMSKDQKPYLGEEEMFKIQQMSAIDQQMQQMKSGPMLNISMQLPPEMAENAEALKEFLSTLGMDMDMMEDDPEEDEDEDLEDDVDPNAQIPFGNNLEDWSPDPSDYLK